MCRYMAEKVIQVLNQVKCNFTIDHFVLNCVLRGGQIMPATQSPHQNDKIGTHFDTRLEAMYRFKSPNKYIKPFPTQDLSDVTCGISQHCLHHNNKKNDLIYKWFVSKLNKKSLNSPFQILICLLYYFLFPALLGGWQFLMQPAISAR